MAFEKPTPNWVRVYLPELLRGFLITSKHFVFNLLGFVPVVGKFSPMHVPTIQYPEQQRPISDRWRGKHRLNRREDGSTKCVACFCCQTVCPAQCIRIEAGESPEDAEVEKFPMKFEINLFECVYCGLCAEACPCDALYMDTQDMKLSSYTPDKHVITMRELMK